MLVPSQQPRSDRLLSNPQDGMQGSGVLPRLPGSRALCRIRKAGLDEASAFLLLRSCRHS